jgi:hypothetical protein
MLPDRLRRVATVVLGPAARDGFALGGDAALAFHGVTGLGGKRIDLVTSRSAGRGAAGRVEKALWRAGYEPERLDQSAELQGIMPRSEGTLAQWRVHTGGPHGHPPRGGYDRYTCEKCYQRVYLELGRAPRSRDPVAADVGPVLHVEDAAGQKVRDLVSRGRIRDFAVTADLLGRWSPAELMGFARRLDPALGGRDFARVADRLAWLPEIAFTWLGVLHPQQVSRVRERFAGWQRAAETIDRPGPGRQRERAARSRDTGGRPGPRRDRPDPGQAARQPRDPADSRQPRRAEPARQEPGTGIEPAALSPAASVPARQAAAGRQRGISRRGKERQAGRNEPEIGR